MRRLEELKKHGGYMWAQYYFTPVVKIGLVEPGTPVVLRESRWGNQYKGRLGDVAVLKTMRMTKVREIESGDLMVLRATRPRQGTISRWPSAADRVRLAVEGETPSLAWRNLAPSQQEIVCSEFLREAPAGLPKLKFLLLPPGRTMKDIDIVAVAEDGNRLLAQVTYHTLADAEGKLNALRHYVDRDAHTLLFCRAREVSENDGVLVVPVALVEEWLLRNERHARWFVES